MGRAGMFPPHCVFHTHFFLFAHSFFSLANILCLHFFFNSPLLRLALAFFCHFFRIMQKHAPDCPRGTSKIVQKDDLYFTAWQDKHQVVILSTGIPVNPKTRARRWVQDAHKEYHRQEVEQPNAFNEYRHFFAGTDRMDQMLAEAPFNHRSAKWYMRLVWFALHAMCNNARILYNKTHDPPLDMLAFKKRLVLELQNVAEVRMIRNPQYVVLSVTQLHLPRKVKGRDHCASGLRAKHRSSTSLYCPACKLYLCDRCYKPYHEQLFSHSPFLPSS